MYGCVWFGVCIGGLVYVWVYMCVAVCVSLGGCMAGWVYVWGLLTDDGSTVGRARRVQGTDGWTPEPKGSGFDPQCSRRNPHP